MVLWADRRIRKPLADYWQCRTGLSSCFCGPQCHAVTLQRCFAWAQLCLAPVSSPPQNASHDAVCYAIGVVCSSCSVQMLMLQGLNRSALSSFLSTLLEDDFAGLSQCLRRPC